MRMFQRRLHGKPRCVADSIDFTDLTHRGAVATVTNHKEEILGRLKNYPYRLRTSHGQKSLSINV